MAIYHNNWDSFEQMQSDFLEYREAPTPSEWEGVNVLFASYGADSHEGDAFVLFERGGQLFEVNGGHCSCYGLEGQWRPDVTSKEALLHRLNEGRLGQDDYSGNVFADLIRPVIEALP